MSGFSGTARGTAASGRFRPRSLRRPLRDERFQPILAYAMQTPQIAQQDASETVRRSSTVCPAPIRRPSLAASNAITLPSTGGYSAAVRSVQAQVAQRVPAGSRSGDGARFAVQANNPRQHMGQHRARQAPLLAFGRTIDGFHLQPGLRRHRLFRSSPSTPAYRPVSRSMARTTWVNPSRSHHRQLLSGVPASARSSNTVGQSIPASARRSCK